jgi:hypothetical protein
VKVLEAPIEMVLDAYYRNGSKFPQPALSDILRRRGLYEKRYRRLLYILCIPSLISSQLSYQSRKVVCSPQACIFMVLRRGNLPYLTCRKRFETSDESYRFLGMNERCMTALHIHNHIYPSPWVALSSSTSEQAPPGGRVLDRDTPTGTCCAQ